MKEKEFNIIIRRFLNELNLAEATVEESVNIAAGLTANIFGQTLKLLGIQTAIEAERIFKQKLEEYMQQIRQQIAEQSRNN